MLWYGMRTNGRGQKGLHWSIHLYDPSHTELNNSSHHLKKPKPHLQLQVQKYCSNSCGRSLLAGPKIALGSVTTDSHMHGH
jgi:hypothetical protein